MKTLFFTYCFPQASRLLRFNGSYYFLLRKGSFFQLNRFFLLFALLFSFVLPLIRFEGQAPIQQINYTVISEQVIQSNTVNIVNVPEKNFDCDTFLEIVYIGGIGFMLIQLLVQLGRIIFLIVKFGIRKEGGDFIIFDAEYLPHFSFFRFIFINQNKLIDADVSSVIIHEKRISGNAILLICCYWNLIRLFNGLIWYVVV